MTPARRRVADSLPPVGSDAGGIEPVQAASLVELGLQAHALLHELRQPLFAAKALAQLAHEDPKPERLDRLVQQLGHLEDLLSYYGDLGRPASAPVVFDFNDAARSAVALVGPRVRSANVDLQLATAPARVLGRVLGARQIVVNLLQNAIDAVEGIPGAAVRLRTRLHAGVVVFEVEDDGPGVPAALRERIFEPYVSTKAAGRGTGLGLYIARRIAEEHGGVLRLGEGPGGARFEVELPTVEGDVSAR